MAGAKLADRLVMSIEPTREVKTPPLWELACLQCRRLGPSATTRLCHRRQASSHIGRASPSGRIDGHPQPGAAGDVDRQGARQGVEDLLRVVQPIKAADAQAGD